MKVTCALTDTWHFMGEKDTVERHHLCGQGSLLLFNLEELLLTLSTCDTQHAQLIDEQLCQLMF